MKKIKKLAKDFLTTALTAETENESGEIGVIIIKGLVMTLYEQTDVETITGLFDNIKSDWPDTEEAVRELNRLNAALELNRLNGGTHD